MTGRADTAWSEFLARAPTTGSIQPWLGASVGHRMQGLSLAEIRAWLPQQRLEAGRLAFADGPNRYLHLMAVTDRAPSPDEIRVLRDLPGPDRQGIWLAMSGTLAAGALKDEPPKNVFAAVQALAAQATGYEAPDSLLPLYAWTAARAGRMDDETLAMVRRVTIDSDFDHLLAKSLLLAAEGNTPESLRFLRAARFDLANLTWSASGLSSQEITPEYRYAAAVYVMHRTTGLAAYRDDALTYAVGRGRVSPYTSWTYALEALMETNKERKVRAICRATFLDPGSFFLSRAIAMGPVKNAAGCPKKLW
jgi:hypothetical protein